MKYTINNSQHTLNQIFTYLFKIKVQTSGIDIRDKKRPLLINRSFRKPSHYRILNILLTGNIINLQMKIGAPMSCKEN